MLSFYESYSKQQAAAVFYLERSLKKCFVDVEVVTPSVLLLLHFADVSMLRRIIRC